MKKTAAGVLALIGGGLLIFWATITIISGYLSILDVLGYVYLICFFVAGPLSLIGGIGILTNKSYRGLLTLLGAIVGIAGVISSIPNQILWNVAGPVGGFNPLDYAFKFVITYGTPFITLIGGILGLISKET
jgi:hypothetical protein